MNESDFRKRLKSFEGYADSMYLDSKGNVTIGVGILLASVAAAQSASLGFKYRSSHKMADDAAIKADYTSVSKAPKSMFPPSRYARYTRLVADAQCLKRELDKRIRQAKKDARTYYPKFASLPSSVQYALIDMSFNLGLPKLLQYRKLKVSLSKKDWRQAAKESFRNGVQKTRNDAIAGWIMDAAKHKSRAAKAVSAVAG